MNILLIGSGGREHCMAWKLKQSPDCENLFILPGNAGTAALGTNIPLSTTDFESIGKAAIDNNIGLLIVGPEEPLVKGIADYFHNNKSLVQIKVIGPSKEASRLEGSKAFAKAFMKRHNIPTAAYAEFTANNYEEGIAYIRAHALPVVLKADGLAAGKGVVICQSHLEALAEFELMIVHSKFGEAGNKVVIEEFLQGIEMSVFAVTDGKEYVLLPEAKDYKRIGEGDTGLNTGGMGAVSPVPFYNEELRQKVIAQVIEPTIAGLQQESLKYTGFLFFGLMIRDGQPMVIEYNCRMGDPETEVVLPRLKNDLCKLLIAACDNRLHEQVPEFDDRAATTIVAVSGGYPGIHKTGFEISGLDSNIVDGTMVFHSGTKVEDDKVVTNGGRVLAVTSLGDNILEAVEQSAYMLDEIYFDGINFRRDIGFEFLKPVNLVDREQGTGEPVDREQGTVDRK